MTEQTTPKLTDLIGIAAHPEGTERVPCSRCGGCCCGANQFHYGEQHGGRWWCFYCIDRGHHADAPTEDRAEFSYDAMARHAQEQHRRADALAAQLERVREYLRHQRERQGTGPFASPASVRMCETALEILDEETTDGD